jgi:hypothetical protein
MLLDFLISAALGITPLEVMLFNMRRLWALEEWDAAANEAERCAPFLHARLSSIDARPRSAACLA